MRWQAIRPCTEGSGSGIRALVSLALRIFFTILFFISDVAQAQFFSSQIGAASVYTFGGARLTHSCLQPNELDPQLGRPIYSSAERGVHVAVGTERGFMGAIMNPNASHLLLIDRDPKVVLFNQINIALLEIAEDQSAYRVLRQARSAEAWQSAVTEAAMRGHSLSEARTRLLLDPAALEFWRTHVVEEAGFLAFHSFTNERFGGGVHYMRANG